MKHTHAEKISARNSLDRQTAILGIAQSAWQEKWDATVNPFIAWEQWKANAPVRAAAYVPWLAAQALHTKMHRTQD